MVGRHVVTTPPSDSEDLSDQIVGIGAPDLPVERVASHRGVMGLEQSTEPRDGIHTVSMSAGLPSLHQPQHSRPPPSAHRSTAWVLTPTRELLAAARRNASLDEWLNALPLPPHHHVDRST